MTDHRVKHKDLERDIFGAGSDLSDSDSERDQRKGPRKDKPKAARRQTAELSSAPESEDYVREKSAKTKKRRPRAPTAGGEEDGAPKKKRKKKAASPQPDVPLTQEEARKLRLDQSIKDILQPNKRSKKRTKKNEDDLDKIADDFVMALREEMMIAANDDKKAHADGLPAVAKLKMLDRVMDTLQKRQYNTAVMDQDLLGACKIWLEPLDAKSLPALNIQKAFFDHFVKMNIDTETLRESGLGRVVLFYTKCKRVIEPIKRIASQLVDTWTRPILKRSSSYRDKFIPTVTQEDMDGVSRTVPKLAVILQQARIAEETSGKAMRKHAVAVPERNLTEYKVAPRFSQSLMTKSLGEDALAARRVNREMLRKLQKKPDGKGEKA